MSMRTIRLRSKETETLIDTFLRIPVPKGLKSRLMCYKNRLKIVKETISTCIQNVTRSVSVEIFQISEHRSA